MKCHKCNLKNADDATYCEFCYERLKGQSAADTYLKAMRRARAAENPGELPAEPQTSDSPLKKPANSISFSNLLTSAFLGFTSLFRRYWRALAIVAAGFLLLILIEDGLNPVIRFHYFGARLTYAFPSTPLTYIFGSTTDAKRWSERGGEMDTPLGDLKLDDVATVAAQGAPRQNAQTSVTITAKNWLLNIHREKGMESHLLSAQTGLLAPASLGLDAHGVINNRQQGSSIRIAKSASFLGIVFPARRIHENTVWSDNAQWTDALDGWSVSWSAQRRWRVEGPITCGDDLCVQLDYDATLTPRVTNAPAWMAGATWRPITTRGTGHVIFNVTQHAIVSHHLDSAATLRASIPNVSRIPKTMRVGRRAFQSHGEIIFDLKNSASLQRN